MLIKYCLIVLLFFVYFTNGQDSVDSSNSTVPSIQKDEIIDESFHPESDLTSNVSIESDTSLEQPSDESISETILDSTMTDKSQDFIPEDTTIDESEESVQPEQSYSSKVESEEASQSDLDVITLDNPIDPIIDDNIGNVETLHARALKVTTIGFNKVHGRRILNSILQNSEILDEQKGQYKLLNFNNIAIALNDYVESDIIHSDATFVYINKLSLMNIEKSILLIQSAITTVLSSDSTKKSLVLIVASKASESEKLINKLTGFISEAWRVFEKRDFPKGDLTSFVDIQIISVSSTEYTVGPAATTAVEKLFQRLNNESRPLDSLFSYQNVSRTSIQSLQSNNLVSLEGVGSTYDGIVHISNIAKSAVDDSLPRLLKLESRSHFPTFVENLLTLCETQLLDYYKTVGISNAKVIETAKLEVRNNVFSLLLPVYRRHVQSVRTEVTNEFNNLVGEDLVISAKLSTDLNNAKNKILKQFSKKLAALKPVDAPSSWAVKFDLYEFTEVLDDYINKREDIARIQGVLPRKRSPVDISYHHFLLHPLGRDYRQDPVGVRNDKPFYDFNLAKAKDVIVKPYLARTVLKKKLNQKRLNKSIQYTGKHSLETDSEFAREMLMFPLSIKNPSVSLLSARGRRKANVPKKDLLRSTQGPERFIKWDIHPLNEVKENLDFILSENKKNPQAPVVDRVLNLIPKIGELYYESQPLRYGSKYSPSNRS